MSRFLQPFSPKELINTKAKTAPLNALQVNWVLDGLNQKGTKMGKLILTIVGIVIGIAGVFATYNVFFLSKPVKELSVNIGSAIPITFLGKMASKNLEVFYKGKPAFDVYFLQVSFTNTGSEPIMAQDYFMPIQINTNSKINILDAEINTQSPQNLGLEATVKNPNNVELKSVLLNKNDEFTVNVMFTADSRKDAEKNFSVGARISGIEKLKVPSYNFDYSGEYFWRDFRIASIGFAIGLFIWVIIFFIITLIEKKNEPSFSAYLKRKMK